MPLPAWEILWSPSATYLNDKTGKHPSELDALNSFTHIVNNPSMKTYVGDGKNTWLEVKEPAHCPSMGTKDHYNHCVKKSDVGRNYFRDGLSFDVVYITHTYRLVVAVFEQEHKVLILDYIDSTHDPNQHKMYPKTWEHLDFDHLLHGAQNATSMKARAKVEDELAASEKATAVYNEQIERIEKEKKEELEREKNASEKKE